VHRAPANLPVPGVLALERTVREADQAVLNPAGINCLRMLPGLGARVWGARTLSTDGAWRYVPVRRLMTMIEQALVDATAWAVFEPHTVRLRFQIVNAVSSFLQELWRAGALAGSTPEEGFYVKCDEETNPEGVVDAGLLVTEVGVAPVRPAEFVVVRIERSREAVQVREVGLG
jgi:phage tail sheath protein FI